MNSTYFCSEIPNERIFFQFLPAARQFFYLLSEQLDEGWQKRIFGQPLNHCGSQNEKCFGKHQWAKINGTTIKMSYERAASHEEENIIFWRWCHCGINAFGTHLW
jgi:hypothetical protein